MSLTKEDKQFFIKLATMMMTHLAWLISKRDTAMKEWTTKGINEFIEKANKLTE